METNIAVTHDSHSEIAQTNIDNRLEELQTNHINLVSTKGDYEDVAEEIYRHVSKSRRPR